MRFNIRLHRVDAQQSQPIERGVQQGFDRFSVRQDRQITRMVPDQQALGDGAMVVEIFLG
jgi:hypothetical protein